MQGFLLNGTFKSAEKNDERSGRRKVDLNQYDYIRRSSRSAKFYHLESIMLLLYKHQNKINQLLQLLEVSK